MRFQNKEASLKLEITNYEFPPDGGVAGSDDRNWLVLRGTYQNENGQIVVDSQACLLTYELRELAAGLKVLCAGVRDLYESAFVENGYFSLSAATEGDGFVVDVMFALPNTMEDIESAELEARMTKSELKALVDELDTLCKKYPDRA